MDGEIPSETRTLVYPEGSCNPQVWLNFVQSKPFERSWKTIGLSDDDLRALEMLIMINPKGAPVVAGTGGLRKVRFAPAGWNQGKRGALRICYVYFSQIGLVYLVIAYCKNRRDDLTAGEKSAIRQLIQDLRVELGLEAGEKESKHGTQAENGAQKGDH